MKTSELIKELLDHIVRFGDGEIIVGTLEGKYYDDLYVCPNDENFKPGDATYLSACYKDKCNKEMPECGGGGGEEGFESDLEPFEWPLDYQITAAKSMMERGYAEQHINSTYPQGFAYLMNKNDDGTET